MIDLLNSPLFLSSIGVENPFTSLERKRRLSFQGFPCLFPGC